MKKLILLIVLAMTLVGCELLSSNYWNDVNKRRAERGRTCYETRSGYVYCEDTK
jgi:hypothetical protein